VPRLAFGKCGGQGGGGCGVCARAALPKARSRQRDGRILLRGWFTGDLLPLRLSNEKSEPAVFEVQVASDSLRSLDLIRG